jgi:excisionase family DNA binding protein
MTELIAHLGPGDIDRDSARTMSARVKTAHTLTIDGLSAPITPNARDALTALLKAAAAGDHVSIVPSPDMLSTQQAADMLRVSRPTLVKMLEDGLLDYEQPGTHRRVPRVAVDAFLASRPERRRQGLDAMAAAGDFEGPDEVVATR